MYGPMHTYGCLLSRVQLFASWWTAAHQVPLTMEFSKQEHWRLLASPEELLTQERLKPASLVPCIGRWIY